MTEAEWRQHLVPYAYDGTEAVVLMTSPLRPADLRRAIAKILQRFYADTVHVDTVGNILDGGARLVGAKHGL
jgi:hypothetical protein